jgi:hypothetical protein
MIKIATILAISLVASAVVMTNIDTKRAQQNTQAKQSVILIGETTTSEDGTQNIEMEIVGLNPEQQFEVTFRADNCTNGKSKPISDRSAIVTSSRDGTIMGFYSGKNGVGLSAVDIRPIEKGNNICLNVNV